MASVRNSNDKLIKNGGCLLRMSEWTEKGRIRRNWTYQKIGQDRTGEKAPEIKETEKSVVKSKRTAEEQKKIHLPMTKKNEPVQIEESKREEKKENGQEKLEKMVDGLTRLVLALTEKVNHIEASVSEIHHVRKTSQTRTVAVESFMTTTMTGQVSEKRRHRRP